MMFESLNMASPTISTQVTVTFTSMWNHSHTSISDCTSVLCFKWSFNKRLFLNVAVRPFSIVSQLSKDSEL